MGMEPSGTPFWTVAMVVVDMQFARGASVPVTLKTGSTSGQQESTVEYPPALGHDQAGFTAVQPVQLGAGSDGAHEGRDQCAGPTHRVRWIPASYIGS